MWGKIWGGKWVGAVSGEIATPSQFDIFCFQGADMITILSSPGVSTLGNGGEFNINVSDASLEMCSGAAFPLDDAVLIVSENIPLAFTVEWVVKFTHLPTDFTDVVHSHIYLGCTDAAGALVGLFFSKVGVAYTGAITVTTGNLELDNTFQVIPGSHAYVSETDEWIVRVAANYNLGLVYLYVTNEAELMTTGHQLRAILPVIPFSAALHTPTDRAMVSVRGSTFEVCCALKSFCTASGLIIPNLAPVANPGKDIAARRCSIIQLDGSGSFDPEGAPLLFNWRLIDAPSSSEFAIERFDGYTIPLTPIPTGFTTLFYSDDLGVADGLDPLDIGDVLTVQGQSYTIVNKGTDMNGFFVSIADEVIPDSLNQAPFKFLRQRGISGINDAKATFYPDQSGFYRFDLQVFDGGLYSELEVVIVNVLESPLPRGCTPDLNFLFDYLSDFWKLVEDRERLATFWSAIAQAVATELYTLWQIEYSKSLRDIQRTLNRRWLHYDLLLGEPLPELTKIRAIWGGVITSFISPMGQNGLFDESFIITSAALKKPLKVTVTVMDPVTATQLADDIRTQLQIVDARFVVTVITNRLSLEEAVRIDAPFFFHVDSTLPVLSTQDVAPPLGNGVGLGQSTYRVDRSLLGYDLREDDFLVLAGVAYRLARVIDDIVDPFPFQRIVIKEALPVVPAGTWQLSGFVSSELLNFYSGLCDAGDFVDFEISAITGEQPVVHIVTAFATGTSASLPTRLAVNLTTIGPYLADSNLRVMLAKLVRRHYLPVHSDVVDVPILQPLIAVVDDEQSLRRNVDFFIEKVRDQRAVRFSVGTAVDLGDVWEGKRPPDRLWAEYTYFDNRPTIEANFGLAVGFSLDQLAELSVNVDYLSAVRGLWYAIFNGPTLYNLRIGAQILLGLPFAEEAGVIDEIRTDFSEQLGRILIHDKDNPKIVRVYRFPKALSLEINIDTGKTYAVGDTVKAFAPLVTGVEVLDYVKDPKWFQGMINQGIFFEIEKYHKFLVRVDDHVFSLNAAISAKDFIHKVKPTYTRAIFIIHHSITDSEISVTDEMEQVVSLLLDEVPCSYYKGASTIVDDPNPAGGGWKNQVDTDSDPNTPAPTFPVPDSNIIWSVDRGSLLCPEHEIVAIKCETLSMAAIIQVDGFIQVDTPISSEIYYEEVAPASVPAGPAGLTLSSMSNLALFTGMLTQLRIIFLGDPSPDADDYEVAIDVNGSEQDSIAFTDAINTELVLSLAIAAVVGDTIDVRVRPASGGARTPSWSKVTATVTQQDGSLWQVDQVVAAGTYCLESAL